MADSTILLSCPRLPSLQALPGHVAVADELQEGHSSPGRHIFCGFVIIVVFCVGIVTYKCKSVTIQGIFAYIIAY